MMERWLLKKVTNRLEEKAPDSAAAAEALEGLEAKTASGESGAILIKNDGSVTAVPTEQELSETSAALLARLTALHDRGALTDAEFEAQKRQVPGS